MSNPVNSTGPRNDAFAGGTYAPAGNPVQVGGTFGGPGAGGFPNPGQPQIHSARNNSGSNVRIPYARLVPMRNRDSLPGEGGINWKLIPDIDQRAGGELTGRLLQQEYEGLDSGELAWIMGRRFVHQEDDGGLMRTEALGASAHGLGMGFGPDRLQRLAYTSWVEGFFRAKFGQTALDLTKLSISTPKMQYLSSLLKDYAPFVAGATVLGSVDVPFVLETEVARRAVEKDADGGPVFPRYSGGAKGAIMPTAERITQQAHGDNGLASGLFVMERGPFLRGKIINSDAVDVISPTCLTTNGGIHIKDTLPRNLGDELAFEGLYAELRSQGMFDWTPDGLVLSKLESPSGDPMGNAELDARSGQLFNIAIQGPAVAKTWSGDPRMACLPLDKVFVVIVADVHGAFGSDDAKADADGKTLVATRAYAEWANPNTGSQKFADSKYDAVRKAVDKANQQNGIAYITDKANPNYAYAELVNQRFETFKAAAGSVAEQAKTGAVTDNLSQLDEHFKFGNDSDDWAARADKLRRGVTELKSCTMCNFRMMRVTSSFLTSYSHVEYEKGAIKKGTRCGLRAGTKGDNNASEFCSEYIIGGWCIGTVLDSAASRSTVGHQVRTAPASMAINVNVNVEWWSGDKLYKHYMDVDGTVHQRGDYVNSQDEPARMAKTDMALADRPEMVSWWPRVF